MPNPDPATAPACLLQVTQKCGRARPQRAGLRFRSFWFVFIGVQGLCGSPRCERVLTRATVCGCAVAGCPSCACPSTWMREVLLAHPLAGDSRKRRSRDFDLKFKSGHLPRYKVRVFCPLLSRSCVRAYARHAQIEMPRPRCAHRCSAGTARFDGSLWGSFKALLGRPCCSWVCFGWLVRLDPADAGNRFSAGGCCMKLLNVGSSFLLHG